MRVASLTFQMPKQKRRLKELHPLEEWNEDSRKIVLIGKPYKVPKLYKVGSMSNHDTTINRCRLPRRSTCRIIIGILVPPPTSTPHGETEGTPDGATLSRGWACGFSGTWALKFPAESWEVKENRRGAYPIVFHSIRTLETTTPTHKRVLSPARKRQEARKWESRNI